METLFPLIGFLNNLVSHWIEFALALWTSAIFVERLIVDLATIKYSKKLRKQFEGQRERARPSLLVKAALKDPIVYGFFILSFALLVLALFLSQQHIEYLLVLGRWLLGRIKDDIWDALALLGVLFVVLLYRKSRSTGSMLGVVKLWIKAARETTEEIVLFLKIILALVIVMVILRVVAANIGNDPRIREIVLEWRDSNFL